MSVFPVPRVPEEGQVVVEHIRAFMFQEAISQPVGFTTCVARRVVNPNATLNRDTDWDWDGQLTRRTSGMSPTLTIAGRSRRRAESVSMVMLVPLVDEHVGTTPNTNMFPYRLVFIPPYFPSTVTSGRYGNQGEDGKEDVGGVGERAPGACTALCLGWSGRGVFVVGRELRLVSPGLLILPPYEMQLGPVFEPGDALYLLDRYRQRDLDGNGGLEEQGNVSGDKVDFDEGMGRFVVARECGGFEVVQLE